MTAPPPALDEAFGFTADDLDANRLGALTTAQQADVDARVRQRRRGVLAAAIAIDVTLIVLWVVLAATGGFSADSAAPVIALGVVTAIALAFVGGSLVRGHVRSRDLRSGRISTAHGPVTTEAKVIREQGQKIGDQYRVELGGVRLLVGTQDQMDAFEPGRAYRVFYVADPPAHHVLSAEPVDGPVET